MPLVWGDFTFGFGVVNIVDGKEQLIVVLVGPAAEFGAPVRHDAQHGKIVFLVERQHPVVEQIRSCDRGLGGVEFGVGHLAVRIDIGLLINPPDALERAHIERVL